MKKKFLLVPMILATGYAHSQVSATDSSEILEPVEVRSIRAAEGAPFTKTNLNEAEIRKLNTGQDLPFLLNFTPAVVVNSDAGNGVGYTGLRIRGTDATRINVTLNGIPYNDAESQGTFFVDLPDFASSVKSIQVQRGVGTSSNGAGAFGATINISTNEVNRQAYVEFNNSLGSFNTRKHSFKIGSGLVGDHFTTDFRLSQISSDGYIDRASSKLNSFYLSTAYLGKKSSLRLNIFSGKEKTYQAWYGVSEADLEKNRTVNYAGMEKPGEPYDNETDNYRQDHYQLFFDHRFSGRLSFNTALFLVSGNGYYEQYKAGEAYADYGMSNPVYGSDTVFYTDLVRQLWLDNDFYGNIFSLQYQHKTTRMSFGGALTKYLGNHFGRVIQATQGLTDFRNWYDNDAWKNDMNFYAKLQQQIVPRLNGFADLQWRRVKYRIDGFRDHPGLSVDSRYNFINPKLGLSYAGKGWLGYFSYSMANKEPNRDDFETGLAKKPLPERLHDFEMGFSSEKANVKWEVVTYYMRYKDQLVLTGQINDVGAYTRTNIPLSYRAGIELQAGARIFPWLNAQGNISFSRNKIDEFTAFVDDYDLGGQQKFVYRSTDIAFSPSVVAGAVVSIQPVEQFEISLLSKYVGRQYLDNTQDDNRALDAFFVQDARMIYTFRKGILKETNIVGQVNNVFNIAYEPNGYTFSYIYAGSLTTENYYFPMAGRNWMVGLNLRF